MTDSYRMKRLPSAALKIVDLAEHNRCQFWIGVLLALAVMAALLPSSNGASPSNAAEQAVRQRQASSASVFAPSSKVSSGGTNTQNSNTVEAEFIWPVDGWIVQGMWAGHPNGIDIGAEVGDEVRAVRAGTVAFAGGDPCCEYGSFVLIAHDEGWSTLYGHLSKIEVKAGQKVTQGDVIGRVGVTGKTSGPHLHFELRSSGRPIDPLQFLFPHRTAPPPPDAAPTPAPRQVAAAAGVQAPAKPTPTPPPATVLLPSQAVDLASAWLAGQRDAAYQIDSSSCVATPRGPNYAVSCVGLLVGCASAVAACWTTLTACVYVQPRFVSASCP